MRCLILINESLNSVKESLILIRQFFRVVAWLWWIAIAIIHPEAHSKTKNLDHLHQEILAVLPAFERVVLLVEPVLLVLINACLARYTSKATRV
jgi:hypothetical protein